MPGSATGGAKGKNAKPPNFLEGPARGAVNAVMPGLTSAMGQAASYNPAEDIQRAIQANWSQSTSRLDPMWQQRQQGFASQMANQGLDPGAQGYDAGAGTLNRAQNDAYTSALNNAIGQGNQTAMTGMAAQMVPFRQYDALMSGSMPGAQQGLDVFNAGQAQQQGKKNGAASMAPYAAMAFL
jgi:hypothetical protein